MFGGWPLFWCLLDMSFNDDFQPDALDTVINVFGLTPKDPLNGFLEMWYQIFLWALFSSVFVHLIAAVIAFSRLRKHKLGRWIPMLIIIMGVLSPLTGGILSSAAIAGVYRAANFEMRPLYALFFGVVQTVGVILISLTRFLSTL